MKLTKDQVKKVAKLANLPLTIQEEQLYSEQLSKILEYIEQLDRVDTSNVETTFNVTGKKNIMAEDGLVTCLSSEEALSNASKKKNGMFETKGVFEE